MRKTILLIFSVAAFACGSSSASKLAVSPGVEPGAPASPPAATPSPAATTTVAPRVFTDADFERHVKSLRDDLDKKLETLKPAESEADFSILIQRPFVVIGDEPKEAV